MLMPTYFDVRFKYPWTPQGYGPDDQVAFDQLTDYRHFFIGINPDRTFNYLRIHDDERRTRMETELANISYAGLEALILWRLSTPVAVLNSMALAFSGDRDRRSGARDGVRVFRQEVEDQRFLVDLSKVPLVLFSGCKLCLMLVAQFNDRRMLDEPVRRELMLCGTP
ncbi:hypothetical protein [Hydrogenophaga sp.]|uniref:hypothetical protein n=1 Tax=Hydrogenophaga sp. TaxID=1904254 RepID=UPI00286D8D43|nr:hypothetical protein [Hydrogenophaga sp.]